MSAMPDFASRLAAAGMEGPELRRLAERLSGMPIARSTIPRWLKGERQPDPWAVALLAVIEKPELLEDVWDIARDRARQGSSGGLP
jgi:hypothetical protein